MMAIALETRKVLPIAEPEIATYAHSAYFMAMLYTDEVAMHWVYSNHVQLRLSLFPNGTEGNSIFVDFTTPCPFSSHISFLYGSEQLTRDSIKEMGSFTDFVRRKISRGYYVFPSLDEYYIPGSLSYNNRYFVHSMMIHGYDDETKQFHVMGFFANQKLASRTVDYEAVEQAFANIEGYYIEDYHQMVHMIRINEDRKPNLSFKLCWVMEQLQDYLNAKPGTYANYAMDELPSCPSMYGIDIYGELVRRIDDHLNGKDVVDHRPMLILWEHKRVMNARLDYMEQNGIFYFDQQVREGYQRMEQSALVMKNLILKYWLSQDARFLHQLRERLVQMEQDERVIMTSMLEQYAANPQGRVKENGAYAF
jgi:hypothetical protein